MDPSGSNYVLYPLAEWVADLKYDDLPEHVALQARLSLLDTLGCVVAGAANADNRAILASDAVLSAPGDGHSATAGVYGTPLSVAGAAKVNSCFASVLELDDNTAGHGSLVTVPVGMAVAQAHHLSGRDLITSMAATYEVSGRLLDSSFDTLKPSSEVGLIMIAGPNSAAAAAQTAKLLGGDARVIFDAINVGLSFTPFSPMVNAKVGSKVKPLLFSGFHVFAGTYGAYYAARGLTAADDSYESEYGGFLRTVAEAWDHDVLTAGLGSVWQLDAPNRKRHACCGYTHSSIDGMWDVLDQQGLTIDDLEAIHVDLHPLAYGLVGSPSLGELTPRGAQFSLPYVLAVALNERRPIVPTDTTAEGLKVHLAKPDVTRLLGRITATADDSIPGRFSARLQITKRDGSQLTEYVQDAVGRGERQFTEDDLEDKFRVLAAAELTPNAIDEIITTVRNIEQLDDVARLADLLTK